MKSINIENLMNHSIGVSNSYYRPQEKDLLDDYLKAVENLTIEENSSNKGFLINMKSTKISIVFPSSIYTVLTELTAKKNNIIY